MNDIEGIKGTEMNKEELVKDLNTLLTTCDLSLLMQELIGSYIMMEEYFMREMLLKVS